MTARKKFDVFLSHNSQDKAWVIQLKNTLEKQGIKVWLDKDEIRPGDLFAKALEIGIEESRSVALIISPESMSSGWVEAEYYRSLSLATNKKLQLIPVLYKKAELPGFLKDRNWVDFSKGDDYDQNVEKLIWGITGERSLAKGESMVQSERRASTNKHHPTKEFISFLNQIKNPFIRGMERKLRMGNAHWIQAGFSTPEKESIFTSVYYENQIKVLKKIQMATQMLSTEVANRNANVLQDAFLDLVEDNLGQVSLRIKQVEELLSEKDFELSVTLSQAGKVILKDIEKVRELTLYAPMTLLSNPDEYDRISDDLSTEIGKLSISIEEYQRYLTTIVNQAKLEKIYSSYDMLNA